MAGTCSAGVTGEGNVGSNNQKVSLHIKSSPWSFDLFFTKKKIVGKRYPLNICVLILSFDGITNINYSRKLFRTFKNEANNVSRLQYEKVNIHISLINHVSNAHSVCLKRWN